MLKNKIRLGSIFLATALPWQVAFYAIPIVSYVNEAIAFAGWSVLLLVLRRHTQSARLAPSALAYLGALALLATVATLQLMLGKTVWGSQVAQLIYFLASAALVFWTGAQTRDASQRLAIADEWAWCWTLASLLGVATGAAQYFQWPVSIQVVAPLADVGRIYGNVHQANHFSTLMVLALPCIAWLNYREKIRLHSAVVLAALVAATVVLTSSRTGLLQLLLLVVWALALPQLRKKLPLAVLASAMLAYGVFYVLNSLSVLTYFNGSRLPSMGSAPLGDSRFDLWRDTLALILQNPWTGIGFGQLEFFHTFSDLPTHLTTIHVNAHLLPLQIALEYGVPVAVLFFTLLGYAFFRAGKAWRDPVSHFSAALIVMVLMHSLTEFPLWYAYFLLPFAFQCGLYFAVPEAPGAVAVKPSTGLAGRLPAYCALAMLGGIVLATTHYLPTIAMYVLNSKDITRSDRLATAEKAFLYKNWIVYNSIGGASFSEISAHPELLALYDKTSRFYMNEFNMAQYALVLAENGRLEHANRVLQALRKRQSDKLQDLHTYCKTAATPGAAQLLQLIETPRPALMSAKDF